MWERLLVFRLFGILVTAVWNFFVLYAGNV